MNEHPDKVEFGHRIFTKATGTHNIPQPYWETLANDQKSPAKERGKRDDDHHDYGDDHDIRL